MSALKKLYDFFRQEETRPNHLQNIVGVWQLVRTYGFAGLGYTNPNTAILAAAIAENHRLGQDIMGEEDYARFMELLDKAFQTVNHSNPKMMELLRACNRISQSLEIPTPDAGPFDGMPMVDLNAANAIMNDEPRRARYRAITGQIAEQWITTPATQFVMTTDEALPEDEQPEPEPDHDDE